MGRRGVRAGAGQEGAALFSSSLVLPGCDSTLSEDRGRGAKHDGRPGRSGSADQVPRMQMVTKLSAIGK